MKSTQAKIVLLAALLWAGSLLAAPASYKFCVSSDGFATFMAQVSFKAVDFGESAARQMVINHVKPHLGKDVVVKKFASKNCSCNSPCPVLELEPKDWDGKLNEAEASTIAGSAAEALDVLVYNTQELFRNPGGFIKKYIFGSEEN